MSNDIHTRQFFSQKRDRTRLFRNLLSKALLVLLPVIVTFLLTQAHYACNVHNQVKIEAEKDLYINQMEIYNALLMIKNNAIQFISSMNPMLESLKRILV